MKRKYVSMLLTVVLTISTVCQSAYGAKSEETMTQETDSVVERVIEEGDAQDLEKTVEETSVEEIAEEAATEEELAEEVSLQTSEASLEDLLEETTESVIEIAESESEEAAGEESEETEGTLSETATTEEVKSIEKSVRKAVKQAASAEVKAEGVCGDNLTWVLTTDGVLTISGTGAMWDMKADQYWHPYRADIHSVAIQEGITTVGGYAFYSCNNVEEITIPNSIKKIEEDAFAFCTKLANIILQDGVIQIGENAFWGCQNLAEIKLPNSIENIGSGAFSNCGKLSHVNIPNSIKNIESYVFSFCSLEKIEIPDSVQQIGASAFMNCENLIEVKLPDGIISIGDSVFSGCSNLKKINLPEGITSIPSGTFQECKSLETISLPNSITSIGAYAFYGCNQLTLSLSDNITDIGYRALDGCKVSDRIWVEDAWYSTDMSVLYKVSGSREEFNVPETVTTIESYAFSDCENLSKVIVPESIKTIKENAFYDCKNVTGLVIPASVTSIGHNALETCGSYSISRENPNYTVSDGILYNKDMTELLDCPDDKEGEVMIPSTVTKIGEYAFYNCGKLDRVVLPNKVDEIGKYAFKNTSIHSEKDYSLEIPDTVTSIGSGAFYGIGVKTITIPDSVIYIGEMAFGYRDDWTKTEIEKKIGTVIKGEIGSEAERYAKANEFVFTSPDSDLVISGKCGENLIYELRGTEETGYDLTIRGQGEMYDYALENKPYNPEGANPAWDSFEIKTVKILDGVTRIGNYAFSFRNVGSVDTFIIAPSVTQIGHGAFELRGKNFYFLGDAPVLEQYYGAPFDYPGFVESTAIVYYPVDNSTWTDEVKHSYGQSLTWIARDMSELQQTVVTRVNITSYGSTDTSVMITLLDGDTELDRIQTTEDTYTFTFLSQGTYTLRASKANHVTRDYEITLGSEDIALDINICPVGDATGDGKVNTRDLNRLYAHVNGTNPLDGYEFACGDVVGTDSTINTRDLNRLYAHISESNLLW